MLNAWQLEGDERRAEPRRCNSHQASAAGIRLSGGRAPGISWSGS
jgi:hypothetical protein